ncbi:non-homologous end joining protein Ku [Aeoliella sp. SH292]|uniref:non-homologous end joining protein Ku n=1 Tax=Aeoliella sp. SH292 TaxID=3454464 RepID=UPI003F9D7C2C
MSKTKSKTKAKQPAKEAKKSRPQLHRPFWSGTLTFGLVNVPVELFPGTRTSRVALRMLAPDGTPLARRFHCPEDDIDVPMDELLRGYKLDSGDYVVVSDEELDAASPEKSREIDLQQFVGIEQIPPRLFERTYYLTPAGDSNKAYRLLAQAMEQTNLAGIATFVMRGKEYLVAILSQGGILRAVTLRFGDEIRMPEDIGLPKVKKGDAKAKAKFTKIIKTHAVKDLASIDLSDEYAKLVEQLAKRKRRNHDNVITVDDSAEAEEDTAETSESVDLLETIRQSLASAKKQSSSDGNGKAGTNDTLADLSKDELYERAQTLDIAGRSSMSKKELLRAVASSSD